MIEFDDAEELKINSTKVSESNGELSKDLDTENNVVIYTGHEGNVEDETANDIQVTIDGDRYEQYTIRMVTRTIEQKGLPTLTVYDALGNTRQVTFDELAFGCTYATYNGEDSLAVNIKETRGIWKIVANIADADHPSGQDYTLEVFAEDDEPTRLIKTYQVPAGTVQSITVYNKHGNEGLKNVIDDTKHGKYCEALTSLASIKAEIATAESDEARQDVLNKLINVTSSDLKTSEDTMSVEITNVTTGAKEEKTVNKITGATVKAYHGIKKVLYDDGTVMEFYRELPTRLFVNCQLLNNLFRPQR